MVVETDSRRLVEAYFSELERLSCLSSQGRLSTAIDSKTELRDIAILNVANDLISGMDKGDKIEIIHSSHVYLGAEFIKKVEECINRHGINLVY